MGGGVPPHRCRQYPTQTPRTPNRRCGFTRPRPQRRDIPAEALPRQPARHAEPAPQPITGTVMHQLIDQHRAEIALLCRRYAVRRLEVFGSAARGTDFDPATSDADFLVEFEPGSGLSPLEQFFGLAEVLERLLGCPVDLVERGAIKNPIILAGINRAREVVYAS